MTMQLKGFRDNKKKWEDGENKKIKKLLYKHPISKKWYLKVIMYREFHKIFTNFSGGFLTPKRKRSIYGTYTPENNWLGSFVRPQSFGFLSVEPQKKRKKKQFLL